MQIFKYLHIAFILLLPLSLTGCGGGDSIEEEVEQTTDDQSSDDTVDNTANNNEDDDEDTVEDIEQRKKISEREVEKLPNAIRFDGTSPDKIILKGTGGLLEEESATVGFTVFDKNGNVVPEQLVTFRLSTTIGSMRLVQKEGYTNSSGKVSVTVNSGQVPSSVKVEAQVVLSLEIVTAAVMRDEANEANNALVEAQENLKKIKNTEGADPTAAEAAVKNAQKLFDDKDADAKAQEALAAASLVRISASDFIPLPSDVVIKSVSDILVSTTGKPDQDSTSLSIHTYNLEGWDYDGIETDVTIRLADHFNTPVPDGTAVTFTTEGGSIENSCITVDGACAVKWTSQNPRPNPAIDEACEIEVDERIISIDGKFFFERTPLVSLNNSGNKYFTAPVIVPSEHKRIAAACYPGRATILATALGEESFTDLNANGKFDIDEPWTDLPEAFRDDNEDGVFYDGDGALPGFETEEFHDIGGINGGEPLYDPEIFGSYDLENKKYNGTLCQPEDEANEACLSNLVDIRANATVVMSTTALKIKLIGNNSRYVRMSTFENPEAFSTDINVIGTARLQSSSVDLVNAASSSIEVIVSDLHNNPPPFDTTLSMDCDNGEAGRSSDTIYNTGAAGAYVTTFSVKQEEEPNNTIVGSCTITATTPAGTVTEAAITVVDGILINQDTDQIEEVGEPNSIQFVSANPEIINLKGTGGIGQSENSIVAFRVLDVNGNPLEDEEVDFSLVTQIGDMELAINSASSSDLGIVKTSVNSGYVHSAVRVRATLKVCKQNSEGDWLDAGDNITTSKAECAAEYFVTGISDILKATTGIPDQNSASMSVETLSLEAANLDGVENEITIRLADHFNTLVPDGTAVTFTAEGGAIQGSCETKEGACSVTWRSQNPKPVGGDTGCGPVTASVPMQLTTSEDRRLARACYPNRVTVLATALGEEYFTDTNGNGLYDVDEPFEDMGEAFRDDNEDGIYRDDEAGWLTGFDTEEFVDIGDPDGGFPSLPDGDRNIPNGMYNGSLCLEENEALGICSRKLITVRDEVTFVMATSAQAIDLKARDGANFDNLLDTVNLTLEPAVIVKALVSDTNNNHPPAGTKLEFECDNGVASGLVNYDIGDGNAPGALEYNFTVRREESANENTFGYCYLIATAPSGIKSLGLIPVVDNPPNENDQTAPILSANSVGNIAATTADLSMTSNETVTLFYTLLLADDTPSKEQIVAGEDSSNVGAPFSGSDATVADSPFTFNLTGLTTATTYYYFVVGRDEAGNISAIKKGNFTTL